MKGWGPALRIAARDALSHKVRSALVLLLISLPVLVVTASLVVVMTAERDQVEELDRRIGAADALVWIEGGGTVVQEPDPFNGDFSSQSPEGNELPGAADVVKVLGPAARLLPMDVSWVGVRHSDGRAIEVSATEVDLDDSLADNLFTLSDGRLPRGPHEVVVNGALSERGYGLGDTLPVAGLSEPATVVGVGRDADLRDREKALGPIGSLLPSNQGDPSRGSDQAQAQRWLVESGPVSWDQVQELNRAGFVVASRSVITDPPPTSSTDDEYDGYVDDQAEFIAVAVLVVAMALLEVVLLAGPAFAVTARSHARTLALVTASGGTPSQARRVILAGGVVLGAVATVAGVVLGIAGAWLLMPAAQGFDDRWFGPFEVPWLWVAVVAACGLLSAFGAAFVPAWIASRQDPVAVLAGRRADPAPSRRQPLFGLVLLGLGVGGATVGALQYQNYGSLLLAASALAAVIGMIFVVPLVVTWTARRAQALPLPVRYAARDAARHRTRTVPAIAAVAATVAGVVAIGIGSSSDEKENRETYRPRIAMGDASVQWWEHTLLGEQAQDKEKVWSRLEQTTSRVVPELETQEVRVLESDSSESRYEYWWLGLPGQDEEGWFVDVEGGWDSGFLVGEDARAAHVSRAVEERAEAALAAGKVVVFTEDEEVQEQIELHRTLEIYDSSGEATGPATEKAWTVPAEFVRVDSVPSASAIVPSSVVEASDLPVETAGLLLRGDLDERAAKRLEESLIAVAPDAEVYVERGYVRDPWSAVVIWALGLGGGLLMLVGTLTATFLAVSDARPDLATLSAVGGSPRTRRGVAAAYALTIGVIGAVLGALVGFVPGIAVSRPLTSSPWREPGLQGPYLEIPWLMIVLVVVLLPILTAAVVWVCSRSRLPMVARID